MIQPLQPTMLWESVDPAVALPKRFQFATAEAAAHWLLATVTRTYGIAVSAVERLTMSSYNLLAWLTTADGPLLAKCCAFVPAHQRLLNAGELVVWLGEMQLPVSAPLVATTGAVQVLCDHLSVGVQRIIPGDLLDPTHLEQAHAAGVTLARLHQALAAYPHAAEFTERMPVPTLLALIEEWIKQKAVTLATPDRMASMAHLLEQAKRLAPASLGTQLVHGDYRAANLLWQAGQLAAVLDFEEVRWGYRINDLAWATVHLGTRYHNWGLVAPEVHQAFLSSYAAVQPLTATEQAWLPLLITWHSINLAH